MGRDEILDFLKVIDEELVKHAREGDGTDINGRGTVYESRT
jgi:hypothetical protein